MASSSMKAIFPLILSSLLCGCSTNLAVPLRNYTDATAEFRKGTNTAASIIDSEVLAQTNARRLLAIQYYLDHPTESTLGFDKKNIIGSFSRYACVGLSELHTERDGLVTLSIYADTLEKIGKVPEDTVTAILADIKELKTTRSKVVTGVDSTSRENENPTSRCLDELVKLKSLEGVPLQASVTEGLPLVISLISSIDAFIESMKTTAKGVLTVADEQAKKNAFQNFVLVNYDTINKVINNPKFDSDLDKIWVRRRQASILLPYERFVKLVNMPTTDRLAIYQMAKKLNDELSEFDQERTKLPPKEILRAVRSANEKLVEAANRNASPDEVWSSLKAFAEMLERVKKDYEDVQKSARVVKENLEGG